MRTRQYKTLIGDFETTVFKGQTYTEVWASGLVELYSEDVEIFGDIDSTFLRLASDKNNYLVYYHNLKFDGEFWMYFLLAKQGYKHAYVNGHWQKESDMPNRSFKYSISDRGQWYNIIVKVNGKIIEFRDSYKLLPFSVKRIGESFKTKHKKLDIQYEGYRYANCPMTDKEKEYLKNDLLVVKEVMEIMQEEGHTKITIGSCCLDEYKKIMGKEDFDMFFPNPYEMGIRYHTLAYIKEGKEVQFNSVGEYVVKSYRGGWCYLVEEKAGKIHVNGVTLDVTSLYPSMMHSISGNYYPVGNGTFWEGNHIPEIATAGNKYYFVRIKCRFNIKPGFLPFIQIKNTFLYKGTESLRTSDVKSTTDGKYYRYYKDKDGNLVDTSVTMTMTCTDYKLFLEHYDVFDLEILDGCWFFAEKGLFDSYINHYKEIKDNGTGALREFAKLFLNNLYGKLAMSTDNSYKMAYVKPDGSIGYDTIDSNDKTPGYIPAGSAITSYARNFTIRTAQANYHGADKPGFIYADTDSIHCDLKVAEIINAVIDINALCTWKVESLWDEAIFTRQKTYIEHVVATDKGKCEPHYDIKCAGMPEKCKLQFEDSMKAVAQAVTEELDESTLNRLKEYNEDNIKFINNRRTLSDFKKGLRIPGKLRPKRIVGGLVLEDGEYTMR